MNRRGFVGALGSGVVGALERRWPGPWRDPGDRFVERWSWAMGQPVHVMVFACSEDAGLAACAAALGALRRVEARLSLFDDASDLCELNRRAGSRPLRVGPDLRAALALALGFRRATGGAFDVAVEPLMRAWGFHRPRRTAPGVAEIAAAREAVAAAEIELVGDVARLPNAHTQLDFGGIGVGYGIDRAVAVLRARGIARAFVDVSGDCAAIGAPPGADGWPVTIADPSRTGETVAAVRLRDAALATSANTVSVVTYGNTIRGHVMNPATGWPAEALCQVSVVSRTCAAADALSTAMLVSGRRPPGALQVYVVGAEPTTDWGESVPGPARATVPDRAFAGRGSRNRLTDPGS